MLETNYGIPDGVSRVDLHLHSSHSGTASNWWVRKLGVEVEARESYTRPEEAYRAARRAGMDFFTLTDHETVEGALTLAHRKNIIVGEEITARFPEDESFVDVLVYGLDRASHAEAQSRRADVYALVDYLREAGLLHVLAHPLYAMPGPLTPRDIEKRIVLFGTWEFVNGSRPAHQNRLAREIASSVDCAAIRQSAARLGLKTPPHDGITGTAGSDDHGCIYVGQTYTEVPKVRDANEFLEAVRAGECRAVGEDGDVDKVTRTAFRIAARAFAEKDAETPAKNVFAGVAERLKFPDALGALMKSRAGTAGGLVESLPLLDTLDSEGVKSALVGRYERQVADALGFGTSGFPALDLLGSLGSFVDSHALVAPYVAVHGYFGRETRKARELSRELFPERNDELRVGVFVDGMDSVHGVATMYRNVQSLSTKQGGEIGLIRCGDGERDDVHTLRPLARLPVPLYDGLELGVPSLVDVLDHISTEEYNLLHVAAPGPLGLAALISGLVLGIPVVGAYHTEFGAYAGALSGDAFVAEFVEVAVREFYERCSAVAVPSHATELSLRNRGYRIRSFQVLKNGVDCELFDPARRDEGLRHELGGGKKILLYVGRVSREKGLDSLAAGYVKLLRRRDDVRLVVVGDGPYREELQEMLGPDATFTGFLSGEELARTFASSDVFVFPSMTDTLGRAVIESQASGLPAVVCDSGGPAECLVPGETGLVAEPLDGSRPDNFFEKVEALLDDTRRTSEMGAAAREFALRFGWESVLRDLIEFHSRVAETSGSDYNGRKITTDPFSKTVW